jgi:predicted transcriptional regulator
VANVTGNDIAQRRVALGLGQVAMARMVGVNNATLCRIEKGTQSPRPKHARRLEVILSAYERGQREAFKLLAS